MTWDVDFYGAVVADSDFATNVTGGLSFEYRAGAATPYASYQLISAAGTDDLAGAGDEGRRRIQLNVTASSPTKAKLYASYATAGVRASSLKLENKFEQSLGRDEEEQTFTYSIDYLIWFDNP